MDVAKATRLGSYRKKDNSYRSRKKFSKIASRSRKENSFIAMRAGGRL